MQVHICGCLAHSLEAHDAVCFSLVVIYFQVELFSNVALKQMKFTLLWKMFACIDQMAIAMPRSMVQLPVNTHTDTLHSLNAKCVMDG